VVIVSETFELDFTTVFEAAHDEDARASALR